jgi:hypothetical protein
VPQTITLGAKLRDARDGRSLSIEESAWRMRMRPDLLRALEEEQFDEIGPHGTVRRSLHSYARFLGLDARDVVAEFEHVHGESPSAIEELDKADRIAKRPPRAKWLVAASACSALLIAASIAGVLGGQTQRPSARAPIGGVVQPRLDSTTASRSRTGTVAMRVVALRDSAVRIFADGVKVFDGIIPAGAARDFAARATIDIAAADGGAIELTVNGARFSTGVAHSPLRARFGPRGRIV